MYLVYGMHHCLNIVTEPAGSHAALLVRAVEPIEGTGLMRAARIRRDAARRRSRPSPVVADDRRRTTAADARLASGPGLVCAAFDLDRTLTGADLFDPGADVRIEPPPAGEPVPVVVAGPRVGIGFAGTAWTALPWRFAIAGNPAVSRPPVEVAPDPHRG